MPGADSDNGISGCIPDNGVVSGWRAEVYMLRKRKWMLVLERGASEKGEGSDVDMGGGVPGEARSSPRPDDIGSVTCTGTNGTGPFTGTVFHDHEISIT